MSHELIRGLRPLALLGLLAMAPAPGRAQATVVILARHGDKAAEPAGDPALSGAGEARATALARAVEGVRLDAVFATEYRRTQRTGAPAADARHLRETIIPVHGDSIAHARAVADALRHRPAGDAVLVVEHSNTIPAIITALGGPSLPELCRDEYASLFVMILRPGHAPRLLRSTFGAADPPEAGCAAPAMGR